MHVRSQPCQPACLPAHQPTTHPSCFPPFHHIIHPMKLSWPFAEDLRLLLEDPHEEEDPDENLRVQRQSHRLGFEEPSKDLCWNAPSGLKSGFLRASSGPRGERGTSPEQGRLSEKSRQQSPLPCRLLESRSGQGGQTRVPQSLCDSTEDLKQEEHSPPCWASAVFFLAYISGVVKKKTVCGFGRREGIPKKLGAQPRSGPSPHLVPQGQQPLGSRAPARRLCLHPVPLTRGQLIGILVKFFSDGFFCSLYFLKWTSVSLFTSIALVLSSCFLPFQTINFIFFIRIQSTQGY